MPPKKNSSSDSKRPLRIVLINGQFPDYYALLGVPRDATRRDIISAYRNLARDLHPDKVGGGKEQNEKMAHVNNARDILTRDKQRAEYDVRLRDNERQRNYARSKPSTAPTPNASRQAPQPTRRPPAPAPPPRPASDTWRYAHVAAGFTSAWTRATSVPTGRWQRRDYLPPGHTWGAYGHYIPPSATWPLDNYHQGTRPQENSAWFQYRHEGVLLGEKLKELCMVTIRICDIANGIEQELTKLVHYSLIRFRSRPGLIPPAVRCLYDESQHPVEVIEIHYRVHSGNEVIQEIMQFAACSYYAVRCKIDETTSLQPRDAAAIIVRYRGTLEKIGGLLQDTLHRLYSLNHELQDWNVTARTVLKHQLALVECWERTIAFPDSVNYHILDTFRVPLGQWQGNWARGFFPYDTFKKPSKEQAERSTAPAPPTSSPPKQRNAPDNGKGKKKSSKSSSGNRMDVDPEPTFTGESFSASANPWGDDWDEMDKIE